MAPRCAMAGPLLKRAADMKPQVDRTLGFTLIELLVTTAIIVIISGMAVPLMTNAADSIKLGQATREVERELQTARLRAVSANQQMRLRFDCPAAGQYRMTELVGTPTSCLLISFIIAVATSSVQRDQASTTLL